MTVLYSIQRLIYYRMDYEIFVYSRWHYFTSCFFSSLFISEESPVLQVSLLAMCRAHSLKLWIEYKLVLNFRSVLVSNLVQKKKEKKNHSGRMAPITTPMWRLWRHFLKNMNCKHYTRWYNARTQGSPVLLRHEFRRVVLQELHLSDQLLQ